MRNRKSSLVGVALLLPRTLILKTSPIKVFMHSGSESCQHAEEACCNTVLILCLQYTLPSAYIIVRWPEHPVQPVIPEMCLVLCNPPEFQKTANLQNSRRMRVLGQLTCSCLQNAHCTSAGLNDHINMWGSIECTLGGWICCAA